MKNRFTNTRFFSGTVFIVPLTATVYFIFVSFRWLDSLLSLPYPGLGVLLMLFVITGFGYLTTNFAFKTAGHVAGPGD
ncbi:MAG: hypothetical protein QM762_22160 [Chryseolinea sp.]